METVTIPAHEYQKILKANHKMKRALEQIKGLLYGVECTKPTDDVAVLNCLKLINGVQNDA